MDSTGTLTNLLPEARFLGVVNETYQFRAAEAVAQDLVKRLEDAHWHVGTAKSPEGRLLFIQRVPRCGCAASVARLWNPNAEAIRSRPPSMIQDRDALRRALGGRAEFIAMIPTPEAGEALRSGQPSVNVAQVWKYWTTSIYQSSDLPIVAVRELIQNSGDAIDEAVRQRVTRRAEGAFRVSWDASTRTLTAEDNGIGMTPEIVWGKFLDLGSTGKPTTGKGGFGVAKAVILGCSSTFRWKLHTLDRLFVSEGWEEGIKEYRASEFRQGVSLVLHDIDPEYLNRWVGDGSYTIEERLAQSLSYNDLEGIKLFLDGREIRTAFSHRGGSRVVVGGNWGPGTTVAVKAYRRPPGDRNGGYFVRLNGLFQFRADAQRHGLKADVVVDIATDVRPGDRFYPLNAARDRFSEMAHGAFMTLVAEVEHEDESIGRSEEYEVIDPDADSSEERDEASQLAAEMGAALNDSDVRETIRGAMGGIADFYGEQLTYDLKSTREVPSSSAAGGRRPDEGGEPERPMILPPGFKVPGQSDDAGQGEDDANRAFVSQVKAVLQSSEEGRSPGSIMTWAVQDAIQDAEQGSLTSEGVRVLVGALDGATEAAMGPGGGGLMQAAAVADAFQALSVVADDASVKQRARNPFGRLAGIRISKKNYDKGRARRFKASYGRWMPYLLIWDATLRLISHEARIRRSYKPGFVLDDEVLGLASSGRGSGPAVVYIHPDRLKAVVKAHKQRPMAIAGFLHVVACHELTHIDVGVQEEHDERYIAKREDLGAATAHLLEPIAIIVSKLLKLSETPAQAEHRKVVDRVSGLNIAVTQMREKAKLYRPHYIRFVSLRVIGDTEAALIAEPPAGTTAEQVIGVFNRHRATLAKQVEHALAKSKKI